MCYVCVLWGGGGGGSGVRRQPDAKPEFLKKKCLKYTKMSSAEIFTQHAKRY